MRAEMKAILPLGILFLILLRIPAWGAEPYPILYRGEVTESGPRLFAHFNNAFLNNLRPADQAAAFTKIQKELEALHLQETLVPGPEMKGWLQLLYPIIIDRTDQIYYVVSGHKFYPVRARGFQLVQREDRCGRTLSVAIETEWITPGLPHEKAGPPPFLDLNREPDGALIFKNAFTPLDEFQRTEFYPIRFPKDLPEGLKGRFKEEIAAAEAGRPSLYLFNAPRTGFFPLEVTLWNDLLPKDAALDFFFEREGVWKEIRFPFDHRPAGLHFARPISRFDLNRNGKMEYLIEVVEAERSSRLIYEVNEERAEAFLMTSDAPDQIFIRENKEAYCRGGGGIAFSLPEEAEKP